MLFEFPPSGGVVPSSSFNTVKLLPLVSTADYIIMVLQIVYILFTLYFMVQELVEVAHLGPREYLSSTWNWIDVIVIVLSVINQSFSMYNMLVIESTLEAVMAQPEEFADFQVDGVPDYYSFIYLLFIENSSEQYKKLNKICHFFRFKANFFSYKAKNTVKFRFEAKIMNFL